MSTKVIQMRVYIDLHKKREYEVILESGAKFKLQSTDNDVRVAADLYANRFGSEVRKIRTLKNQ